MDTLSSWSALAAGLLVGSLVFGGVANLIRVSHETLKQSADGSSRASRIGLMVLASFASSGFWTVVVVLGVFFALKAQPWAPLLYAGTAAWTLCSGLLVLYAVRRNRRRAKAGIEPRSLSIVAKDFMRASTVSTSGPVKATYTFELDFGRVDEFNQEIKRVLAEHLLHIESEVVDVINWHGKKAFVALYINRKARCMVIVGARQAGSHEWQKLANHLEPLLMRHGTTVEAHVQSIPDTGSFGQDFGKAIKVEVPIDFQAFNRSTQLRPVE